MELCREESLASKWLENRDPELDIYKMYREILKAVRYLHEQVSYALHYEITTVIITYILV